MKIQYPKSTGSEFNKFGGLDLLSAHGEVVNEAAKTRGWRYTGYSSAERMLEISDIRKYAKQSSEERERYTQYQQRQLSIASQWAPLTAMNSNENQIKERHKEFFEEHGEVKMLTPDAANEQYGIENELSFSEPVSNLEAHVLHGRKQEEIKFNFALDRAYGSQFWKGMGLELVQALLDPAMVPLLFIPPLGGAKVTAALGLQGSKLGTRAVTGGLAGFYGSLAIEPLIYGAATQEQAHYNLINSLMNVTFGTVAGGGLHSVGGAVVDGLRYIRKNRHMSALNTAVNQAVNGESVEVSPIAHGSDEPQFNTVESSFEGNPNGRNFEEGQNVPIADSNAPVQKGMTGEYKPHSNVDESLGLIKNAEKAKNLSGVKLKQALSKSKDFLEAVAEAARLKTKQKLLFRVKTKNGDFVLVRGKEGEPLHLFSSDDAFSGKTWLMQYSDDFAETIGEATQTGMLMHGVDMAKSDINYAGTIKLEEGFLHHVIEVNNADFNPKMNQKDVVIASPKDAVKLFEGDASIGAFADQLPSGPTGVKSQLGHYDKSEFLYEQKFQFDEQLLDTNLKQTGDQAGTQKGGFFKDAATNTDWYVKYPKDTDIAKSEFLAAVMYRLFGVEYPEPKLVGDASGKIVGVASKIIPGGKMLTPDQFATLPESVRQAFLKDLPIDMFLGNWDVVGNAPNFNLMLLPNGKIIRIDAGGSLMFRAQGGLKDLDPSIKEFQSMLSASKSPHISKMVQDLQLLSVEEDSFFKNAIKKIFQADPEELEGIIRSVGLSKEVETNTIAFINSRLNTLKHKNAAFSEIASETSFKKGTILAGSNSEAKKALKAMNEQTSGRVTEQEGKLISSYTGSGHIWMNRVLRGDDPFEAGVNYSSAMDWAQMSKKWDKLIVDDSRNLNQIIKNITNDFTKQEDDLVKEAIRNWVKTKIVPGMNKAFDKFTVDKKLELWRGGVPLQAFNGIKGLKLTNQKGSIHTARAMIGETIKMNGFTSSSLSKSSASTFGSLVKINTKPGQKMLYADQNPYWSYGTVEYEVLLPHGSTYFIKDVIPDNSSKGWHFELDLLLPGEKPSVKMPMESSIKIAQKHKEAPSNGVADINNNDPDLQIDPNQSQTTLKPNASHDLANVTKEIDDLQELLNAEIANIDPAYVKAATDEIKKIDLESKEAVNMAKDLYDAAKAAAVCIRRVA